jgi:hypothetical protein
MEPAAPEARTALESRVVSTAMESPAGSEVGMEGKGGKAETEVVMVVKAEDVMVEAARVERKEASTEESMVGKEDMRAEWRED